MTSSLTTLDAIKAELSIADGSQNAYLTSLIQRASARLESLCGERRFAIQEDVVEMVAGYGTSQMVLSQTPVVSIGSIVREGVTVDASSYEVHAPDTGIVWACGHLWVNTALRQGVEREPVQSTQSPDYTVTYTAGYVTPQMVLDDDTLTRTLPYDVEEAVLALAVQAYHDKGTDRRVVSEGIMSAKIAYKAGSATLPSCVSDVVARYRRWS